MKYVVSSTAGCAIGPGQRVRLTKDQIATREHAVTVLDEKTGEVEPTTQIVFKRGEILNLPEKFDDLSSYLQTVLEPASKAKVDDKSKPAEGSGINPDAGGAQSGGGNNAPNPAA